MTEAKSEDLWNPYKDLYEAINKHVTSEETSSAGYAEFETSLRKYRQSFFSLLNNLPKNAKSREELRKGQEEGIAVKGVGHQILSKDLFQEVTILSDMYDMNEYVALDLLCTAQMELPFFPDLPRGLVAIVLYYDARKFLVSTLRLLLQARSGVSWSLALPPNVQQFINGYTEQLFENGLFTQILELLKKLDLAKEMEMLQNNLALGGPKHRKQVSDSFNAIRVLLADCIFLWSAQSGLNKANTLALIKHLKEIKLDEDAAGKIDDVNLYLLMALLYAVDLSILHIHEDGEEIVQQLPILSEVGFVDAILKELSLSNSSSPWACIGLQSLATFGAAVCLSSLRLVPQGQKLQNILDYEDEFVDAAIGLKVFEFIHQKLLENELFFEEEMMVKRIHNLFSDFIVQMFPKVKELRLKADETARTIQAYVHEGLEVPSNLSRYFENLLLALAKLYAKDPLKLQLMLDYWCLTDGSQNMSHYRAHPRSVSLFKFVRLAGDLLPASLFVNYLSLLASLANCPQGARNCFNMLKQPSGFKNSVSWDHFFMSFNQYYSNLKQELPSNAESLYRHSRLYNKGITPQEIDGLRAVLKLMKMVSDQDEFSRMALCEHPGWAPLTVLLGLVSCSIPIPLKADILEVMGSLSKSKEIAARMWNNLEASQILVTIPSTSSYQPRGIQTELDEIECRLEEYPLTKAFLHMLNVLTNSGISRTLGAGSRQPGFDPYLIFIVNSVFLKFNGRNYKNPDEKWELASICLQMLSKFLDQYEPDPVDFQSQKANEFNSPPGFHLMLQLHSKSELFNGILFVIDEVCKMLESYVPLSNQKFIESASYYALCIINRCLKLQTSFFSALSASNCPVLLVNMHKLLLTLNPRTGRPDYVITIMKYMGHLKTYPRQCMMSVKILQSVTTSPVTHTQIVNILISSKEEKGILAGIVFCLDETVNEDNDYSCIVKKDLFTLMHQCLAYNPPTLTHFLFGFDMQRAASTIVFQPAGVLNTSRTCLHSLLMQMKQILADRMEESPSVIEGFYKMLYGLCSNQTTAEPVLRLLRTQSNFFKNHINFCMQSYKKGLHELNQLSWLLKTMAIELRFASCNKQLHNLKQLTVVLVGLPREHKDKSDCFSFFQTASDPTTEEFLMTMDNIKHDNFLMRVLADFDLNEPACEAPEWGFFEQSSLESYLANCQTDGEPKLIDIAKLHRNLLEEVTAAQGTAALGQRQAMLDEIQKVLVHAININKNRNRASSITQFVDAWRQVVEVLVIFVPTEIITPKEQVIMQIYLLENILKKCARTILLPEVAEHLSGAVVVLMEHMRCNHVRDLKLSRVLFNERDLDGRPGDLNIISVQIILDSLVEWIILSDNQSQRLRMNLYAALATFLQLIRVADVSKETKTEESNYVSRLDSSKLRVKEELSAFCISSNVLASFGEKLINVLCYDCTSGFDICKMLATACFGMLLNLSGNVSWISYMSGRGYIKHIIDGILKSDTELRRVLEPVPEVFKSVFLYCAKMAFMCQIANTRIGAELLLEHKILSILSAMKVFDFHPELRTYVDDDALEDDVISVTKRYAQVWEPAINLCHAILSSLGTDHHAANVQITNFLLSNLDVIDLVLRSAIPTLSGNSLREVSLVSAVLARTADNSSILDENIPENSGAILKDNRAQMCRIRKMMLNIVPRFILNETTIRELLCDAINERACYRTSERLSFAFEIVSNLLLYCRNVTKNNGIEHDSVGVIFQPTLNDTSTIGASRHYIDHNPSLGVVIEQLINSVSFYHKERNTLDFLRRKEKDIPSLDAVDLKEFGVDGGFDLSILREDALQVVTEKLHMKSHNVKHCLFIIEHAMYIIWSHLDYYMLKTIPKTKGFGPHSMEATLGSSSEAMWKVTVEDISNLKQGLVSIFNETFCRQILEVAEGRSESDAALIKALLRKIKRLIQFVPVN